jgi:serine/threonine protein kinase
MEAPIRHPKSMVTDLDPRLDHIVMKLLERDPKARYQSAAALAADLEAVRASPAFSAGALRLRSLVRTRFPEQTGTPALGTSFTDTARATPGNPFQSGGSDVDQASFSGGRLLLNHRQLGDRQLDHRQLDDKQLDNRVSPRVVISIVLACLVASAIFWLLVS